MFSDQCDSCINYYGMFKCRAFPKGIPDVISDGEHDHTESFKGDNGIRFEPIEDKP